MEIDRPARGFRTVSFVVTVAGLAVIIVTLGVMVVLATGRAAGETDEPTRDGLVRLAYVSMVLLGLAVVLLGWVVARHLGRRMRSIQRDLHHEPTPYVDAWSEAGRRAKAPEEDSESER